MNINKVTITVDFGNDEMQTEADFTAALRNLAKRIDTYGLDHITKVMDNNGNNVGTVECER